MKISFLIILSCALAFLDFYFMSSATKGHSISKPLCRAVSVFSYVGCVGQSGF